MHKITWSSKGTKRVTTTEPKWHFFTIEYKYWLYHMAFSSMLAITDGSVYSIGIDTLCLVMILFGKLTTFFFITLKWNIIWAKTFTAVWKKKPGKKPSFWYQNLDFHGVMWGMMVMIWSCTFNFAVQSKKHSMCKNEK